MNEELPKVRALVNAFCEIYPNAEFEFAHVVLSDFNMDDGFINDCLSDGYIQRNWGMSDLFGVIELTETRAEYDERQVVVAAFLRFLLTIPEKWRIEWVNEDYR